MTDLPLALDIVTAAVAGAALALSIVNFRFTGSFVKVRVAPGMVLYGADGRPQRGNFVSVSAYNLGRTEVGVTSVGFVYTHEDGRRWLALNPLPGSNLGPAFPHTLRAGHSASWFLDAEQINKDVEAHRTLRGYVQLGNYKVRLTRKKCRPQELLAT